MKTDYVELHQYLEERLARLGNEIPGPMTGFARLHKKAVEDGALSRKTKEMIALAIGIVVGCEGCIAYHVHDAITAGAPARNFWKQSAWRCSWAAGPVRSTLLMPLMPSNSSCRAKSTVPATILKAMEMTPGIFLTGNKSFKKRI